EPHGAAAVVAVGGEQALFSRQELEGVDAGRGLERALTLAAGDVPDSDGGVEAGREQPATVRREDERENDVGVALEGALRAAGQIEQDHVVVFVAEGEELPVRGEGQRRPLCLALEAARAGGEVPESEGAVHAQGREEALIGRESQLYGRRLVPAEHPGE